MTDTEFQSWLHTLTPEQRAVVDKAVGFVMGELVMLETRMAKSEAEMILINTYIEQLNTRINTLECLYLPEHITP